MFGFEADLEPWSRRDSAENFKAENLNFEIRFVEYNKFQILVTEEINKQIDVIEESILEA